MIQLRRSLRKDLIRKLSQSPANLFIHHLTNRNLIRVSGNDASNFLQGLITNDINHLEKGPGTMFTMFLNTKGRVLYDSIIYTTNEINTYFLECDTAVSESLQKHLKMYRVRRKVDIVSVADEYKVFASFNPSVVNHSVSGNIGKGFEGMIVPCDALKDSSPDNLLTKFHKDIIIYRDPRLINLGSRIITRDTTNVRDQLKEIILNNVEMSNENIYRHFRYTLGVGEGIVDLPPADCFPLEANCDYLHGVSFHKGCYIGQELTARTHHTGVVRKRLMPLFFKKKPSRLPSENKINDGGANLGKLRGVEDDVGLGLLRIAKVLELKEFNVGDGIATVTRPGWWPIEASKERFGSQKS